MTCNIIQKSCVYQAVNEGRLNQIWSIMIPHLSLGLTYQKIAGPTVYSQDTKLVPYAKSTLRDLHLRYVYVGFTCVCGIQTCRHIFLCYKGPVLKINVN